LIASQADSVIREMTAKLNALEQYNQSLQQSNSTSKRELALLTEKFDRLKRKYERAKAVLKELQRRHRVDKEKQKEIEKFNSVMEMISDAMLQDES